MSSFDESSPNTNTNSELPQNSDSTEEQYFLKKKEKLKMDTIKHRYPYCIVWTPIPCISWLIPSIGHAGICNSEGIIHDFAAPYYISVDNMAFGYPTKAVILELTRKEFLEYDKAVEYGKNCYKKLEYDFFTNNCHSFIATVLNKLQYKGRSNYTMVDVWWILTTKSKYLSWIDLIKSYYGFLIVIISIFLLFFVIFK